jgi:hypothetical protein
LKAAREGYKVAYKIKSIKTIDFSTETLKAKRKLDDVF